MEFENCTFDGWSQGPADVPEISSQGIATASAYNHTIFIFKKCIFHNNYFPGGPSGNPVGYAIATAGSAIEIHDSCFFNNTWKGWAPIHAFGGSNLTQSNNYVDGVVTTTCNFAAVSSKVVPDSSEDIVCVSASLNESCTLMPAPTPEPVNNDESSAFSYLRPQVMISLSWVVSALFDALF